VYRLLDLFCGAGIGADGYATAGLEVVGVDNKPQPNYPFEFHQADALEYLAEHGREFDAIHASPPCPRFSSLTRLRGTPHSHPDLIDSARKLLISTGMLWVIENVEGAPLRVDFMLCGTMFGIPFPKHRIFELSFPVFVLLPPCDHTGVYDPFHGGEDARQERTKLCELYGVKRFVTRQEVRNGIPKAYTKFIGRQIIKRLEESTHD
jgi:DNA (cytosine-5)-methyltransferase 1